MSTNVVSRVSRPPIRLRPVPPLDPPFDDEVSAQTWTRAYGAGQLVLDWPTAARDPTVRAAPPAVPAPAPVRAGASVEARGAVRRFLGMCLEILNGYRPVGHLRPLSSPVDLPVIVEQVTAAVDRVADLRRLAGLPHRVVGGTGHGADPPVSVQRLRVCEPRAGAAEATVVLGTAGRTWALALRLERRNGSWAATVARLV